MTHVQLQLNEALHAAGSQKRHANLYWLKGLHRRKIFLGWISELISVWSPVSLQAEGKHAIAVEHTFPTKQHPQW